MSILWLSLCCVVIMTVIMLNVAVLHNVMLSGIWPNIDIVCVIMLCAEWCLAKYQCSKCHNVVL
jgi:hypothetical protein